MERLKNPIGDPRCYVSDWIPIAIGANRLFVMLKNILETRIISTFVLLLY